MEPKRVIIVHGWLDNPTMGWLGWIGDEMRKRDLEVLAPVFKPTLVASDVPPLYAQLKREVGRLRPDDVILAHSMGTALTLRFLSNYEPEIQFKGVVMVAGMSDFPLMRPNILFDPPLNFEKVIRMAKRRIVISSDNDRIVPPYYTARLALDIHAEARLDPGKGHFTGLRKHSRHVPSILDAVNDVLG